MKEKELYAQVGKRITAFRKQRRMTVQNLANECDMEKSNLIPIEKGRINITLSTLLKIAQALNVSVKDLFD